MPGTVEGGKKAAATNILRHGKDFYREIGAKGGRNGHTGGFAANPELARIAGRKGGQISKRGAGKATRSDNGKKHMKRDSIYWKILEEQGRKQTHES